MPSYRADPSPRDKAKAIAGVFAVYAVIVGAVLTMPADSPLRLGGSRPTVLIDIDEPPEPPPPDVQPGKADKEEGAAGKKAEPAPIVVPKPRIELPTPPPIAAAPVAGTGSAMTAGAAASGTGPGAGGAGAGHGGGGSGGGGGIGTEARLLGGNSSKLPSRLLRQFTAERGYGLLLLAISESGRVSECSVLQSTGSTEVDQALCSIMLEKSRWSAARDRRGNPIPVKVRYTATWRKD